MRKTSTILVIEDDAALREQILGVLEDGGYAVAGAANAEEGLSRLRAGGAAVVVTDLYLPGADGLAVLDAVRGLAPLTPVLVVTARASVDTAVDAMRRGAFHYLPKPFTPEVLLVHVEKAIEHARLLRDHEGLRARLSAETGLGRLWGESPEMGATRELIRNLARSDAPVLITGETGTGKELVANALHFESPRAGFPLVKVNCAAISETLLESELFGHEKGAFTGAEKRRQGKFERADGGTLFLDEISEMGEHLQAKLLRVLQGAEFERVGGDDPIRVDVRVLAATNRPLEEALEKGRLREDLYYRLNVLRIDLPPLRERGGEIAHLARRFVEGFAERYGKRLSGLSGEVLEVLGKHSWPGNVRELENVIERAVVLARGETLGLSDLPALPGKTVPQKSGGHTFATLQLEELERAAILRALDLTEWNKTRAAELLGIFPSAIYKRMRRHGIPYGRRD